MKVTVSSGNTATLTLLESGSRSVLDCAWDTTPTRRDREELARGLSLSVPVLDIHIEDSGQRAELIRSVLFGDGGSEVVQ